VTAIPPNWLTSITGTQGAQHQSSAHHVKETADQARRAGATPFADSLHNVIDNKDQDGQVFTDAEGTGSQGRPFTDEQQSASADTSDAPADSGSDAGHIDIEA
jgi:hypothetical protein